MAFIILHFYALATRKKYKSARNTTKLNKENPIPERGYQLANHHQNPFSWHLYSTFYILAAGNNRMQETKIKLNKGKPIMIKGVQLANHHQTPFSWHIYILPFYVLAACKKQN